ncbi:MAG: hypothetical protein ACFFAH_07665 [Promethearchaeota archaeon]
MDIYNLFLIVKKNTITIGAADKTDDKMIIYHSLTKLQSEFIKRYNSQSELDYWSGEILMFKDFRKSIRNILKNGKIGERKKRIPLFKIYKKSFLKLLNQEEEKKIEIKEGDYRKFLESKGKSSLNTEKRLPKQPIAQGFLNPHQYKIAHLVDGFHTAEEIAAEMKLAVEEVFKVIKLIDDLGLLEYIELI